MVLQLERPRITEIQVRIDCNGCIQKIKKALHGINGIYDFYIDFQQQKLTVIGWADPERIIKAIKKVRKVATICSHTEAPDPNHSYPTETPHDGGAPPPEGGAPEPDAGIPPPPPPVELPNMEAPSPLPHEPPNNQPPPPQNAPNDHQPLPQPPFENPPPPPAADSQPENNYRPKHVEGGQVIYHRLPDYGYGYGYSKGYGPGYSHGYYGHWGSYPGPSFRHEPPPQPEYHEPSYPPSHEHPRPVYHEPPSQPSHHEPPSRPIYNEPSQPLNYHEPQPQPAHVTHGYNTYRPSPYITEYEYVRSPPQYITYGKLDNANMDPYWNGKTSKGNFNSMLSDDNPNACTIA